MDRGPKRKLSLKTVHEKYSAIKEVESGKLMKDVATKYGVPHNTLSTWMKNKNNIIGQFESLSSGGSAGVKKKFRVGDHEAVDKALYKWVVGKRSQGP